MRTPDYARLAALIPPPRVNLTRGGGVFAPNGHYRARVTPGKRGRGRQQKQADDTQERTPAERRASMTPDQVRGRLWAQRLKRVFNIEIEPCTQCGGPVKVIASIEDPKCYQENSRPPEAKGRSPRRCSIA